MAADPFMDEDARVLTPEAFDFVLRNELKRAVRSQNFLTLLVVDATSPSLNGQRTRVADEVARLVSREVRETDLLSRGEDGQLSIVLLDADLPNSMRVVDRLLSRFEHYAFATATGISVGAACCPTHGSDAETLRRSAETRPLPARREPRGHTSTAQ
jgi:GGDEF domain-containing protein